MQATREHRPTALSVLRPTLFCERNRSTCAVSALTPELRYLRAKMAALLPCSASTTLSHGRQLLFPTALTHHICYWAMGRCLIENATRRDSTAGAEMRRRIKLTTRRELTSAISQRYRIADRSSKKLILDEFTKVTGYHRTHAIRILTTEPAPPRERLSAPRIYREAVKETLIVLWEAADRICGKRLKALLPQLVEAMERHKHLQLEQEVRAQVLAMSAATIDRQLCSVREHAYGGRK